MVPKCRGQWYCVFCTGVYRYIMEFPYCEWFELLLSLERCKLLVQEILLIAFPFWPWCVMPSFSSSSSPFALIRFPSHFTSSLLLLSPPLSVSPFSPLWYSSLPIPPLPSSLPTLFPPPLPTSFPHPTPPFPFPCTGPGGVPVCHPPIGGEFPSTDLQRVPPGTQGDTNSLQCFS